MPKILHVIEKLDPHGGAPRKLLYLLRHSQGQGLEHAFVTMCPTDFDVEFSQLGAAVRSVGSTRPGQIVRAICAALANERPQVMFSHSTRALVCGGWVSRRAHVPLVHNFHGPVLPIPSTRPLALAGRAASAMCLRRVALVLANSQFTAGTIERTFGLTGSRLRVLLDPVEPRTLTESGTQTAVTRRNHSCLRLTTIGGLIPIREHEVLLEALHRLVNRNVDAKLTVVGDGPRGPELRRLTQSLGLTSRVHWVGYQRDVASTLAATDVYLNATRIEGFGIAVVEAMLQGLPVVVSGAGSHPELVTPEVTGLFFRPGDVEQLTQQLARLANDPDLRLRIGAAAREHAQRSFAPSRFVSGVRALVAEACQR